VANVERHEKHFETAAMWYRRSRSPSKGKRPSRNANDKRLRRKPKGKRMTPFVMHKRMTQIANAARKLLRHLEVTDPAQAPDGPGNAILEVLASAEDGSEDAVIRATSRIGRLVEILETVDAARELEHRAHKGAEDVVQIGKLIVPKGHHGEAAVNDWIAAMPRVRSNTENTDSPASAALIGMACLLGRQAAREWAERHPEVDCSKPPLPLPEKQP
jgi:hypothetical protein